MIKKADKQKFSTAFISASFTCYEHIASDHLI